MKITFEHWTGSRTLPIREFVTDCLDVDRDGAVESAAAIAENAIEALGRLCEILATRGKLSAQDIIEIAGHYGKATLESEIDK